MLKVNPPDTAVRVESPWYRSLKAVPSQTTSWMLAPGKFANTIVRCSDGEEVIVKLNRVFDGMTVEAVGATAERTGTAT